MKIQGNSLHVYKTRKENQDFIGNQNGVCNNVFLDLNFIYHWVLKLFKPLKKIFHKSFNYSSLIGIVVKLYIVWG